VIAAEPFNLIVLIAVAGLILAGLWIALRRAAERPTAPDNVVPSRRGALGAAFGLAAGLAPGAAAAASADPDLAARIGRIEDRTAIQELAARYAWHVARGEGAQVAALFTDDGRFDGSGYALDGKAALTKFYVESIRPQMVVPLVQNFIITQIDGDEARGTCKIHSPWQGAGTGFCGWYEDRYRRGPDGWLFVERMFTLHQKPAA